MFSSVVYRINGHKYKVESTDNIGKPTYYKSLNSIPTEIGDKVKQLMWVSEADQSIADGLGVRIGTDIFWII